MMPNKTNLQPTIDKHSLDPNELTTTCFVKCLVFLSRFLKFMHLCSGDLRRSKAGSHSL